MHIEKFQSVIHACRFCFMCRHLAPVGNVTFRESDTPRGRALLLDKVIQNPALLENPDFQTTLYDAELSAACRTHCVSHIDETGLLLAARRDAVESNNIPENIRNLAKELTAGQVVKTGNSAAEIVYYVDHYTSTHQPEIAVAMEHLLRKAGLSFRTVSGLDSGKALSTLGFHEKAQAVATIIAQAVRGGKTLVTSCPAAYDAFKNDYAEMGMSLDMEVLHSSELILRLLESKKLIPSAPVPPAVYSLASDYLRNYQNQMDAPERVMKALGITLLPFGFNNEESYSAGEGAVIYDRINPRLAALLVAHIEELADDPSQNILLTASPYTKFVLRTFGKRQLQARAAEEIVAATIK